MALPTRGHHDPHRLRHLWACTQMYSGSFPTRPALHQSSPAMGVPSVCLPSWARSEVLKGRSYAWCAVPATHVLLKHLHHEFSIPVLLLTFPFTAKDGETACIPSTDIVEFFLHAHRGLVWLPKRTLLVTRPCIYPGKSSRGTLQHQQFTHAKEKAIETRHT